MLGFLVGRHNNMRMNRLKKGDGCIVDNKEGRFFRLGGWTGNFEKNRRCRCLQSARKMKFTAFKVAKILITADAPKMTQP